jgi:predicted nucleic acid-binding protein
MHRIQVIVPAVLDASFWINAVRCGIASHLADYFSLVVTPVVAAELSVLLQLPQPPEPATLFQEWLRDGRIQVVAPERALTRIDVGENEAIALAQEQGWALLIDNSAPRDWSRGPAGLRVIDSPAFAILLYDHGRLTYPQCTAALAQSRAARRVVREALIWLTELARRKGETVL